ncbi:MULTISPECIES: PP2C family protein-serine/threonine phosphatase [Deinococcus]|uniref:PP2C family protein-serine/threonine phosphatase n=1 Tax=Deinococcus rufus TaxID=2136097 RepID=A0ABV7Z6F5_9DEIO|nr:protein phosphatase 2C domain-containing protein [Deinococcus sp. AB2017081]WQE95380.1 protein phosphatase 2C domain-containing protein [Deinococcus sp. AB2017081]
MRASATPAMSSGLLTDVGRQRQGGVNQDAALALDLPRGGLYAVADGMGGHAAGELAANLALDALSQHYLDARSSPPVRLAEAVQAANMAVLRHAVGEYVGMGTTLLVALIDRGAVTVAHVGDSRAYLLRRGDLYRLTEDHSWVAEQVRLGHMTEQEARDHQWRSVVSNALGGEERVRLELFGFPAQAGDRLLLCSDGLSGVVLDHQLLELLGRSTDPDDTARALVNAANDAGGPDNITAVVVDVHRDVRLPAYPLPQRMEDGPTYVDVLLSAQRGNSLITYLLLMIAYFTLLGVMLIPERRVLLGLTGTTLLVCVLIGQRLWMARRSGTVLSRPTASPDRPATASPPGTLTGRDHPAPDSRH